MAKIKSYTDLEQSKKLAEILPLESADMYYFSNKNCDNIECGFDYTKRLLYVDYGDGLPCWSLAALYDILPNNKDVSTTLSRGGWNIKASKYVDKWFVDYEDEDNPDYSFTLSANNQVDACYEMILKLHEQKLL